MTSFSVPDWDAGASASTSFNFNKKILKARKPTPKSNKAETGTKPKPPIPSQQKKVNKSQTVPGQFVRMNAAPTKDTSDTNKKRKSESAPAKLSIGQSHAKKSKLTGEFKGDAWKKKKNPKEASSGNKKNQKSMVKGNNQKQQSSNKSFAKGNKPENKFAKPIPAPAPKKKTKVKPPKKVELVDEESDSELAAEVNKFRKELLKGFTGPKESDGTDKVDFSEDDVDFTDSDDEPKPKKTKNADKTPKETTKEVTKKSETAPADNSFREKLIGNLKGSRFRFLNEVLYSNDGSNAVKLFKEDRAAFSAYHEGYRQQVEQWPLNPLDRIIKSIKKLPKTLVIADFGCGEGRLAKAVPQKTYSLDLVAQRHEIIACDMAKTPLETKSIDVAVYCLSLMGTNLKDFLLEANRVLKVNGILKIAEVESRFDDVRKFVENVKACGFQHVNSDTSSKFFVFLNFKKVHSIDKGNKQVPSFSLKPCLYKKR